MQRLGKAEQELVVRLAVFHWFDESILTYIWCELLKEPAAPTDAWTVVQNLPFLEPYPDQGFTFHELYRNAILYDLWNSRLVLYRRMALEAARYFEQSSEDISARVERVYHLFIGEPFEGRKLCVKLMEEFQDNGRFGLWHSLNQSCLEHLEGGRLDQGSQALVLESCGRLANVSGNRKEAIEKLERALDLYRAIRDKGGQAGILFSISWNYNHEGFREKAIAALQSAYQLFIEVGNLWYAGESLFRIGEMRGFNGEVEEAYRAFEQALEVFSAIDAPLRQADALVYMGMVGFLPDEQALDLYQRASRLYRRAWKRYINMSPDDPELANPFRMSGAKMLKWRLYTAALNEGDCLREIGRKELDLETRGLIFAQAEAAYQRAVKPALEMFDVRWISRIRLRLGDIKVLLGQTDEALDFYKKALDDAIKIDHKLYIGWAYIGLGDIALESGDNRARARKYYLEARELYLAVKAVSNIRDQIEPRLARLDDDEGRNDVG